MAEVPRYSQQAATSGQRIAPQQIAVQDEAFGTGIAKEVERLGATGVQVGERLAQNAIDMQERVNISTADDMTVQFTQKRNELLFDKDDSFYNLSGKDAFDKRKEYEDKLVELRESMAGGSENPHVRQLFDQQTRRDIMLTMNNMSSHAASELRKWEKQSTNSYFETLKQQAGMAQGEDEFQGYIQDIIDQSFQKSDKLGLDPYSHELFVKSTVSEAYVNRVTRLALEDPIEAQNYFDEHRDEMLPEAALQLEAKLQGLVAPEIGDKIAQRVMQGQAVGNVDNVLSHIIDDYEGHALVTDSNGYKVKYGINAKYNRDIDLSKLTKEGAIERYKEKYWGPIAGENIPPNMVLSALDSSIVVGPEKTRKWLQQADGDLEKFNSIRMAYFNSLVKANPKKYEKYLKSWTRRVEDSTRQGMEVQPQQRKQVMAGLPEMIEEIRSQNLPSKYEKQAIAALKARVGEAATVAEAQYLEAKDNIVGFVADNNPRTLAEALKDPTFFQSYNTLSNNDQLAIERLIGNQAKVPMTAELYDQRKRWIAMSQTDPGSFSKIDFAKEWGRVPEGMVKEMQNIQLKLNKKENVTNPAVARMFSYAPVKQDMIAAGLLRKNGQPKDRDKWNQFYGDALETVEDWMDTNKRKPTPDEYREILAPLFARTRTYLGPIPIGDAEIEYKPMKRLPEINNIPRDEYSAVYNMLKQRYPADQITNAMVYDLWQAGQ